MKQIKTLFIMIIALAFANLQDLNATEMLNESEYFRKESSTIAFPGKDNPPTKEETHQNFRTISGTLNIREYCIPESDCSDGDGFEYFTLGDIENTNSGCSPNGYGDYTDLSTLLYPGETYSVNWTSGFNNNNCSLWIDFNQDSEFDEDELLISDFPLQTAGEIYATDFTLPTSALDGETTLRIRGRWQGTSTDPCINFSYGETEDYTVIISATQLAANVGVQSIFLPSASQPGEIIPQAIVKNYGTQTQNFPVELTLGDYASTIQISDLAAGEEILVEFDPWIAEPGAYIALACTQLAGDEYINNDCESTTINVIANYSAYGYVFSDINNVFDESWVAFDVNDPGTLTKIADGASNSQILGTTLVGDVFYCVEFAGGVFSHDLTTGAYNTITPEGQYIGIDYDGENFYVSSETELFTLDVSTGETTLIGSMANPAYKIEAIAFDGDGELWGIDHNTNALYRINKETASTTLIGYLGGGGSFVYHSGLSFDKTTNTLYFTGAKYITNTGLYTIDLNTGFATLIGSLQNNVQMPGLAVISAENFAAPPRNLSANANGFNVELSWDEPIGGAAIEYNIYRNNEQISTVTTLQFLDENLEVGTYVYTVTAVYTNGESVPTEPVEATIGNPEVVTNPEFIDAVVEMGESANYELIISNAGNLDLEFNIAAFYVQQMASNPVSQEISPEAYKLRALERFGTEWQDLLDSNEMIYNPEGINEFCEVFGTCSLGDGINDFILGQINNVNSGCSNNGYGDFTDLSTSLDAGMVYELTVSSDYADNYLSVWVDLNQDEIFDESEKLVDGVYLQIAGETYVTQIAIPVDAPAGETRMRAISSWLNPDSDPCGNMGYGEAEDYSVVIDAVAPWISFDLQTGTIAPNESSTINVTVDADGLDPIEYMAVIEIATNDSNNKVLEIPVNLMIVEQGISNFFPVWQSPFNPMSVFLIGAQLDGEDLALGDEIGIFDIDPNSGEEICVGAGLVISPLAPDNILEIIVSMDDGSIPGEANGFTPGNNMIFKIWNSFTGVVESVSVTFPTPGFDEVFTPLGTAIAEINGEALVTQPLNLTPGWNLISSKATPQNQNIMAIFNPLMDMGILEKVLDEDGGSMVYLPFPEPEGRWVNSIGNFDMNEGYYVKVTENATITVDGMPMELPMALPLEAGWNIMSYPAESPQNALELLEPLINDNNVYKVVDEAGGVIQYLPFPEPNGTWVNTIGNFENGEGYYIKVFNETSLMIEETPGTKSSAGFKADNAISGFFEPVYQNNPYMPMHFMLYNNGSLETGDEVGIFDGDVCVGASVYDGNTENMAITVTSMDDPDTENQDGYTSGNDFEVRIWKAGVVYENVETELLAGPETFTPLESYIGNISEIFTGLEEVNSNEFSFSVFPNPNTGQFSISLQTENAGPVQVKIFNSMGVLVYQNTISDGSSQLNINLGDLPSGVYQLVATQNQTRMVEQIMIK
jgi:hypothetical protein